MPQKAKNKNHIFLDQVIWNVMSTINALKIDFINLVHHVVSKNRSCNSGNTSYIYKTIIDFDIS